MVFTPNIPFSGQTLGSSRDQVRGNFTNYQNLVSIDHVGPLSASGQGQHLQVTFNKFGNSANYPQTGNQSYLYSYNGSNAGSNLVYQPSVVAMGTLVPATARAVCRASYSGGSSGTWTLSTNGPYGANSTFNVSSITSLATGIFTVNFSQMFSDANYFVMFSIETSALVFGQSITVYGKTTSGFNVAIGPSVSNVAGVAIMVF